MRIGMFTEAYTPVISGVVTSVNVLANELRNMGHEVYIFVPNHDKQQDEEFVVRIGGRSILINKGLKEYKLGFVTRKRIKLVKKYNLDLVHCHTEFLAGKLGRKVARKIKVPYVHTYHTMYEDYIHFITKFFYKPIHWYAIRFSLSFANSFDKVIFPTKKVSDKFLEYGFKKDFALVPTGLYLDKFSSSRMMKDQYIEMRMRYNLKVSDFVVMFLGRVSKEKSVDKIVNQFKVLSEKYSNIKLLIVGNGPDILDIRKQVNKLKLDDKVILTGMVPYEDVYKYYRIADLFVNFSVTETQGLTYIEALASSLPILVKYDTNLDGVINEGVNGYSFTEDDDFQKLFEKIYNDKDLYEKMKINALESSKTHSAETFAKSIMKVYSEVLQLDKYKQKD